MQHLTTRTSLFRRYTRQAAAIIPLALVAAIACADATRITSIDTELKPNGAVTRQGAEALASARSRGVAMAVAGDSSLLWHLEAMDLLRTPTSPSRYEEPTGSEQPTFVAPTYTRATISPYDGAILVETSYKYAYYLELSGQWSLEETASGRVKGSASYSWEGATPIDWNTQTRHHALEIDVLNLPSSCGLTLVGGTTHKISRTDAIPGYDIKIKWSPAEAYSATRGDGRQNACPPPGSCETPDPPPPSALVPIGSARLTCSPGGGDAGYEPSTGYWVTATTCYGYHYYDENGEYMYSEITHCTSYTYYVEKT